MTYGTIVVCGGGCYGGYYVRQLARARAAGAMSFERVMVVDRDAGCRVARLVEAIHADDVHGMATHGWAVQRAGEQAVRDAEPAYRQLPIEMVVSEWAPFFDAWFAAAIGDPARADRDAVVPSPLMPHLLADWVAGRIAIVRNGDRAERVPLAAVPDTPWQRTAPDQAHYASFATWMCPINCIEPPRCPETKGPRDWTMPAAVRRAADAATAAGQPYDVVALFHTTHRHYGVGMFDVRDAVAVDAALRRTTPGRPLAVLVASVSHCHGALAALRAGPPQG